MYTSLCHAYVAARKSLNCAFVPRVTLARFSKTGDNYEKNR